MRFRLIAFACVMLSLDSALASYGNYVGKNCTADGSVFLGGYGDEPSSHWLEIVPRREHPAGAKIKVGATNKARCPGERSRFRKSCNPARTYPPASKPKQNPASASADRDSVRAEDVKSLFTSHGRFISESRVTRLRSTVSMNRVLFVLPMSPDR